MEKPRRIVYWTITHNCNYDCKFCGLHNKVPTPYVDIAIIDRIAHFITDFLLDDGNVSDYSGVDVSGGEPTLHPNIKHAIKVLSLLNDKKNCINVDIVSNFSGDIDIYKYAIDMIKNLNFRFTFHSHHTNYNEFISKYKQLIEYGKNTNTMFNIYYNLYKNRYTVDQIYDMFSEVLGHRSYLSFNNIIYDDSDIVYDKPNIELKNNMRYQCNEYNTKYNTYTYCHQIRPYISPGGIMYQCLPAVHRTAIVDILKQHAETAYNMWCNKPILCDAKFCCSEAKYDKNN